MLDPFPPCGLTPAEALHRTGRLQILQHTANQINADAGILAREIGNPERLRGLAFLVSWRLVLGEAVLS